MQHVPSTLLFLLCGTIACSASTQAPSNPSLPMQSDGTYRYVEFFIEADRGATLRLDNGAQLVVPAGALKVSQTLRFAYRQADSVQAGPNQLHDDGQDPTKDGDFYYEVTPSQVLNVPATITMPYPLDANAEVPQVLTFSEENPLADYGTEQTRYAIEEPLFDDKADKITLELKHFSGIDLLTAGQPAYLVMDVPAANLEPADILMTLTRQDATAKVLAMGPGPAWAPGHVGIYVGEKELTGARIDSGGARPKVLEGVADSVEAVPDKVHATNVDWFRRGFHDDHVYLGPRRPRQPLAATQQAKIASQAPRAIGKPYALLGDAGSDPFKLLELMGGTYDPFASPRGYSCVGLVDVLYVQSGRSLVSVLDRAIFAATPKDMMESTVPVRSATLQVGVPFTMDFTGVIRRPEFSAILARVPYTQDRRTVLDGVENAYDIEFESLPPGAQISNQGTASRLTWTPSVAGTYSVKVRMRADVYEKRATPLRWVSFGLIPSAVPERRRDNPIVETMTFTVK
jgi:hypothetical protein